MLRRSLAALVLALTWALASVDEAAANDRGGFSLRDVDGPTAFAFDGFVAVGGTMVPAAATGRFIADGRGRLTDGVRTLVVGGNTLHQTFTCTYTVNSSNGTGTADCDVVTGTATSEESFDFVIVERKKEAFFTATTPGVTIRGRTQLQK